MRLLSIIFAFKKEYIKKKEFATDEAFAFNLSACLCFPSCKADNRSLVFLASISCVALFSSISRLALFDAEITLLVTLSALIFSVLMVL